MQLDNLQFIETNVLDIQQKLSLRQLWNDEYPEKLAYETIEDFGKYLDNLTEIRHILIVDKRGNILGWAFSFSRANERWFAIILSGAIQHQGLGRILIDKLKSQEDELNGWVIDQDSNKKANKQNYLSPLGFYRKCGFNILTNQRLELEKISAVKIKWKRNKTI